MPPPLYSSPPLLLAPPSIASSLPYPRVSASAPQQRCIFKSIFFLVAVWVSVSVIIRETTLVAASNVIAAAATTANCTTN